MSIEINGHPAAAGAAGADGTEVRRTDRGGSPAAQEGRAGPERPVVPEQDSVSLTDSANRLKQLEAELGSRPVVDAQRVADIRAAIAGGRYQVDAQRVADRMVQMETDLLGVQKPPSK